MLIRERRCGTTGREVHSTGTLPTSLPPSSPAPAAKLALGVVTTQSDGAQCPKCRFPGGCLGSILGRSVSSCASDPSDMCATLCTAKQWDQSTMKLGRVAAAMILLAAPTACRGRLTTDDSISWVRLDASAVSETGHTGGSAMREARGRGLGPPRDRRVARGGYSSHGGI